MARVSIRRRRTVSPVAIIAVILAVALTVGIVFWLTSRGEDTPDVTSSAVSSEASESETPQSGLPDGAGDIIFRDGEGYDLLSVVNKNYNISASDGQPELITLSDEVTNREGREFQIDARAAQPLADFLGAARANGHNVVLWSSYRTQVYQNNLYEKALENYISSHPGATREEAVANVNDTAPPGTSEHCTGLAVDIYTWAAHNEFGDLDPAFDEYPAAVWMMENAHYYGFILRYPEDKEDITMINYEPWHYRYVGIEVATELYEKGITLEEYTGKLGE